jgi:ABC-type branched-subunit amino acid transport system ATPase component
MTAPLLDVRDVTRRFGGKTAVNQASLQVGAGEVLGLIGPNGAGKTTLFNCISGHLRPSAGTIRYDRQDITGWSAHRRARHGIGRTFQIVRPFRSLTVRQQVEVGAGVKAYGQLARSLAPRPRRNPTVDAVLAGLGLTEVADRLTGTLPLGLQRRIEIARAEALGARLLLLDEPGAGLTEAELGDLAEHVRALRDRGRAVLLIEHSMDLAMSACDRIVVLVEGHVIADGTPDEVRSDKRVVGAYLGEEGAA